MMKNGRWYLLGLLVLAGAGGLMFRTYQLQFVDNYFLEAQGKARFTRVVPIETHRGMLLDRRGEILAVSTPVHSVVIDPGEFASEKPQWNAVASSLGMKRSEIERIVGPRQHRHFAYLKRGIDPQQAQAIRALGVAGLRLEPEDRRFYPIGEAAAQLLGFTDIDDRGIEGLELRYQSGLAGTAGAKRMVKDLNGRWIEGLELVKASRPGSDVSLSIDRRIQSLVYRELKEAVRQHRAKAGTAVVLDGWTGEVLAMANLPSFNPNDRSQRSGERIRNRAVTHLFEPGSTIKPFTVAAALRDGACSAETDVDTTPGELRVGRNTVRDTHDYGMLDVTGVITKSSNVGAVKIARMIPPGKLERMFRDLGLGASTDSGFPGEAAAGLRDFVSLRDIEYATIAFGYGLEVTALQLARAYAVFATGGHLPSVNFQPVAPWKAKQGWKRVMSREVSQAVSTMLETVVSPEGTASRAAVSGYRVMGKTGTAHIVVEGQYARNRYRSLFVGMAPASRPRLVMVIVVEEPGAGQHYGGQVAAPVFSRVMSKALRLLDIEPDRPEAYRSLADLKAFRT